MQIIKAFDDECKIVREALFIIVKDFLHIDEIHSLGVEKLQPNTECPKGRAIAYSLLIRGNVKLFDLSTSNGL